MAQFNNDLDMYRTAADDKKKKQETPAEMKSRVAKKIFTAQEEKKTTEPQMYLKKKMTKKKETPAELKARVSKKIFTAQEERRTTDEPPMGLSVKKSTKTISRPMTEQEKRQQATYDKEKQYRPQGDEIPKTKSNNVMSTLNETTQNTKKPGGYKISGNPTDFTPEGSTDVNKQHRKKVNNILGK